MINSNPTMPYTFRNKAPIPKAEARRMVRGRVSELTVTELKNKSASVIERLLDSDDYNFADKIFAYYSVSGNIVNTKSLISTAQGQRKSVFLPKLRHEGCMPQRFQFTDYDELVKNELDLLERKIGIDEDLSDIDLIIVPCLAVSLLGERIGFEGMNYNSLLRNSFAPKIVLAFEFQVFNRIEYERQDVRIDRIITERRIINTREN